MATTDTQLFLDDDTAPQNQRRVLVVDDSPLQLRLVATMLERWGFEVDQALSGEEALEKCRMTPPDLILSDWMMPGMKGPEFCRRYRALKLDFYGYFILLTAKTEKEAVAEGLDAGADDYLSKPVSPHELRARINAGARIVSMQRQLAEKNREVTEAYARLHDIHEAIENDLRQARKIQQSLVPERFRRIGRASVSLLLHPCGHVGGDLVGMFTPAENRLGLYSIDVSGHGITSAMVTARVAGYLSSKFPDQNLALEKRFDQKFAMRAPAETLHLLNQRLAADPGVEEYLTMAYLTGDSQTGCMRLVQAGHPPPLLLRANGEVCFLGDGGLPIGLIESVSHPEIGFSMEPGDRLLMYSDGFTEAAVRGGGMLEERGLADLFVASCRNAQGPELLEDMFWRLTQAMPEGAALSDDVSAALLEFGLEGA
jgi:sigma-B regulation protein RsbU (phosphoserine phosphatase)